MIQRIQSVYLLLASLLSLGLAFYFSTAAIQGSLFTLLVENYGFYSLPILCVFILLRFKKRNLQLMLTSLTLLIQVFFLVVVFVDDLPLGMSATYYRAALPGWIAFINEPLLGIGPGNFRLMCPSFITPDFAGLGLRDCYNHPHQFIIQLLAETGLLGTLFGLLFMWTMVGRT
ncbi:MAG: DUF4293 family protein, partial [Flavobacteriia bacterium]|nr:DUF4293 family protein [Flavobacteriia bacterium]